MIRCAANQFMVLPFAEACAHWENIILVQAASEAEASAKAEKRGRQDEGDDAGSFLWDGAPATWELAGVRKLTACEPFDRRPGDLDEITTTSSSWRPKQRCAVTRAVNRSSCARWTNSPTNRTRQSIQRTAKAREQPLIRNRLQFASIQARPGCPNLKRKEATMSWLHDSAIRLVESQISVLQQQAFDDTQPGSVLRDFRMLLDFVGADGVPANGKHNLLPMSCIDELDQRLTRPLRLKMKRPQLRSHPYLAALHLLLRATGLGQVQDQGSKARLAVDPEALAAWCDLNPTEQYFNLLEAGFVLGRMSMIGERSRDWPGEVFSKCAQAWQTIPRQGKRFDPTRRHDAYLLGIGTDFALLALLDLLGLVDVEFPEQPQPPWRPAAIHHRPFGDALFAWLMEKTNFGLDIAEDAGLGHWQPLLGHFFPAWRKNFTLPQLESQEGNYVFDVKLGKVARTIAMPSGATLHDLLRWVLKAYDFDDDHLYEFSYRNQFGGFVRVRHPYCDEGPFGDEARIGDLPLQPGQGMDLLYDFGDNWHFSIKLKRIDRATGKPRILERRGKAPVQYR